MRRHHRRPHVLYDRSQKRSSHHRRRATGRLLQRRLHRDAARLFHRVDKRQVEDRYEGGHGVQHRCTWSFDRWPRWRQHTGH